MNNFTPYAERARREGNLELARRIEAEGRIVSKLVKTGLEAGYFVSVNDGEEWTVKGSTSYTEIMDALGTTDMDYLRFRDADNRIIGTVTLVYGNGAEVIGDYSAPNDEALETFSAWVKPVEAYADKFEAA